MASSKQLVYEPFATASLPSMRQFVSLPLPESVRRHLWDAGSGLAARWGVGRDEARWVTADNLHVTIKFLGEVADKDVSRVVDALGGVQVKGTITLRASALCFEPRRGPPRLLAAEFDGDVGRVATLHQRCEEALEDVGFAPDRRKFWVHATLARFRVPMDALSLEESMDRGTRWPGPLGEVNSFELMSSTLRPEGPLYAPIAAFPLTP